MYFINNIELQIHNSCVCKMIVGVIQYVEVCKNNIIYLENLGAVPSLCDIAVHKHEFLRYLFYQSESSATVIIPYCH